MLAVGGGIIAHETHILSFLDSYLKTIEYIGGFLIFLSEILLGAIVGFLVVKLLPFFMKFSKKSKS
jgi:hypothetical protein